jgi:hypothetical protein
MVTPPFLRYVLRTRKFWVLGLLVLGGMALAWETSEMVALKPVSLLGAGLTLWPLWLMTVPAVAALAWAAKGMGWVPDWDVTAAGRALVAYGLVGVGILAWLRYGRRSQPARRL